MRVFRVLPFDPDAAEDEPGGVFFHPSGGKNRADSPALSYSCLYVGDSAAGAIAEAFGRFDMWDRALIEAQPASLLLPNSSFALATYELSENVRVCDLNSAERLLEYGLRPSDVVTRDRVVSQAWAANIQQSGIYAGVSWWSYYNPAWRSMALWDLSGLALGEEPRALTIQDPDVQQAASMIARRIVG